MAEPDDLVLDTARRLFAELDARPRDFADAWAAVEAAGLPLMLAREDAGGLGLGGATAAAVVRLAAARAIDLPIGEAMIGAMLSGVADGVTTIGWDEARIPWGAEARRVLVERDGAVVAVGPATGARAAAINGSPRAALADPRPPADGMLLRCGAALRTIQLAGAAEGALALTIDHVTTREQFGRPLAKFQAIQQEVARMGGQVAVMLGAAGIAADWLDGDLGPSLALAAAKARASEAAGVVAAIAHQAHGAIGFTKEYRLGQLTKSLWTWRAEAGGAAYWQDVIGGAALAAGGDGLWPLVTAAQGGA